VVVDLWVLLLRILGPSVVCLCNVCIFSTGYTVHSRIFCSSAPKYPLLAFHHSIQKIINRTTLPSVL